MNFDLFFIYFKDLKKKCQKELEKFMKKNEMNDIELIIDDTVPVIVLGNIDDEPEHSYADEMVS